MNKITNIQMRVEEALESIRNIERAMPRPFFYTRLEARLKAGEKNVWESLSRVITRPVLAFGTLSIVLIINAFVVVSEASHNGEPRNSEIASIEDIRSTSYYDIENIQP